MITNDHGQANKISRKTKYSVRVPAYGYLTAMFVGTFFSALLFYLELNIYGYVLLGLSLLAVPVLALTDTVVFDGKRVYRSGVLPRGWAYALGIRFWLKLKDVEQVETRVVRAIKRGGRTYFRYHTVIRGKGLELAFSSGGREYREMVRSLLPKLSEEVLDAGSLELRDYVADPKQARRDARLSDIPPADVLEHAFRRPALRSTRRRYAVGEDAAGGAAAKASKLRLLGNQLRLSGLLLQAMESFRRAASICPDDPWLLFDFARCIRTYAISESDDRLERKAAAMLRLAERRAGGDGRLLIRLGESYSEMGEWGRAGISFRKAVDAVGEQFRAIRGMAEIALRDGKLAHVVHNFAAASRLAETSAARRWSRAEADYFSRLNNDDEYMDLEIGRVNLLDALARWRQTTLKLAMIGFPAIALGLYFEDSTTANAGWILSAGMLIVWIVISVGSRMFTARISPELLEEE